MKQNVLRKLQGERPGMSAGAGQTTYSTYLYYPIAIQTQVRIADVSFWQEDIDFHKMRASGIDGVIIRAGQRNWADTRFKENWQKAKEAGLPRGSYWLYDSREDPKAQAALWWSLIKDDPGELVHVADLEESYGGDYGMPSHMRIFIQEFQRLSGLPDDRIAIYTGFFWWTQRVGNDAFFRRFALWIAWYATMSVVQVPAPWIETDLFGWQYTSHGDGTFYGVSSLNIDLNWYCCDARTYSLRFNLGAPPPDDGGTMAQIIKGVAIGNVTRRKTAQGEQFNPPRYLLTGNTIEADRNLYQWLHLTKINGVALTEEEWASAGSQQQYIKWEWEDVTPPLPDPEPDPVPTIPDLPVTIILGDDVTYARQTINITLKPKV